MCDLGITHQFNMCFGCSKEPSRRDGSSEYPQHMFCSRNKKNDFQICTLFWRPDQFNLNTVESLKVRFQNRKIT